MTFKRYWRSRHSINGSDRDDCKGIAVTGHSTQNSVHSAAEWDWKPSRSSSALLPGQSWWIEALQDRGSMWDMPGGGDKCATWHLEPDCGSVKVARGLFTSISRDWGMGCVAGDAELVISELVTNALRHAPSVQDGDEEPPLQAVALCRGDEFVCAVRDHSDLLPAPREPDYMAETGRGLHLVACFSRRWGVVPASPRGKYVWALLT